MKKVCLRVSERDAAELRRILTLENARRRVQWAGMGEAPVLTETALALVAFRLGLGQLEEGEQIIAGKAAGSRS